MSIRIQPAVEAVEYIKCDYCKIELTKLEWNKRFYSDGVLSLHETSKAGSRLTEYDYNICGQCIPHVKTMMEKIYKGDLYDP